MFAQYIHHLILFIRLTREMIFEPHRSAGAFRGFEYCENYVLVNVAWSRLLTFALYKIMIWLKASSTGSSIWRLLWPLSISFLIQSQWCFFTTSESGTPEGTFPDRKCVCEVVSVCLSASNHLRGLGTVFFMFSRPFVYDIKTKSFPLIAAITRLASVMAVLTLVLFITSHCMVWCASGVQHKHWPHDACPVWSTSAGWLPHSGLWQQVNSPVMVNGLNYNN